MYVRSNINTDKDTSPKVLYFSEEDMEKVDISWAGEFRRTIMKHINEDRFSFLFSSKPSRCNYPVAILIGIMILAPFLGVSEEIILALMTTDISIMYALGIEPGTKPPSKRTLIRFRGRLIAARIILGADVMHEQALIIAQAAAESMSLRMDFFRIDSTMLNSFIKVLSRQQLLYRVNQGMVYHILGVSKNEIRKDTSQRQPKMKDIVGKKDDEIWHDGNMSESLARQKAREHALPEQLFHYLCPDDYNRLFYGRKSTDSQKLTRQEREAMVLSDAYLIWTKYQKEYGKSNEFTLFMRVIAEQCERVMTKSQDGSDDQATALRFKPSKKERSLQATIAKNMERLKKSLQKAEEEIDKLESKSRTLTPKQEQKLQQKKDERDALLKQYVELKGTEDDEDDGNGQEYVLPVEAAFLDELDKMNSSILQTPVDPDSTFCEKANLHFRGYKITIIEASDGLGHSIPIEWITSQNNVGDAILGGKLIKALGKLIGHKPGTTPILAGDGGFSGPTIEEAAKEAGIMLVNTDLTGRVKDCCADHLLTDDGQKVKKCAGGQEPEPSKSSIDKNGIISSKMSADKCRSCKYFKECQPTINGNSDTATMKTSLKQRKHAIFKRKMGSQLHLTVGNFRNGVEALMSLIKRVSFVTKMPIYTLERVALYNDFAMLAVVLKKKLAQEKIDCPDMGTENLDNLAELYDGDEKILEEEILDSEKEFQDTLPACASQVPEVPNSAETGAEKSSPCETNLPQNMTEEGNPDTQDGSSVPTEKADELGVDPSSNVQSETETAVPTGDTADKENPVSSASPTAPRSETDGLTEASYPDNPVLDETGDFTSAEGMTEDGATFLQDESPDSANEAIKPVEAVPSGDPAPDGAGSATHICNMTDNSGSDSPDDPPVCGEETGKPVDGFPPDDPVRNETSDSETVQNAASPPLKSNPTKDKHSHENSMAMTVDPVPPDKSVTKDVTLQVSEPITPSIWSGLVEFIHRRKHHPHYDKGG